MDDPRHIRVARFLNILDDAKPVLSPVKVNAWAANLAAISAAVGTGLAWMSGHMNGIEQVWAGAAGWLTQAHVTHHMDKRERNKADERMAEITRVPPGPQ